MRSCAIGLLLAGTLFGQGVRVDFDPEKPAIGPFPNDILTIDDEAQKTGRRVNLPLLECSVPDSDCAELALVNQLDGFHINPRIAVKFSGPVNPDTLREGVFLLWLETAYRRPFELGEEGKITPINQVQWDPATNTAYAKPDQTLEQGRRFAIIVTDAVRDTGGNPVGSSEGFDSCVARLIGGDYCTAMSRAAARVSGRRVVGGSVFTTLSATAWLESAYAANVGTAASFTRTGSTPVVSAAGLRSMVWRRHTSAGDGPLEEVAFPVPSDTLTASGIGRIAFGSIRSPRYLNQANVIDPAPTGLPVPPASSTEEIYVHVFLPAAPAPAGGYPVILAGHGLGDSRFGLPSAVALNAASRGIAVVAMTAVGHGFGPRSALRLTTSSGTLDIPAAGRGADFDGDGQIGALEGCVILAEGLPIVIRDCLRQTALDYMSMVRAIRAGMDLDGDGRADLDGRAIYYVGQSLGAFYGTLFNAVDPDVPAAVLNVGGGSAIETSRWSPTLRLLMTVYLSVRRPLLLNEDLTFNEQYPERYQAPEILRAPGAAAIGELLDRMEWIEAQGAPMSFAPLLRSATPLLSPAKRVLFQIAAGDRTVPNPSNSALIRAANMREFTSLYRHDLAREAAAGLPQDPHGFLGWLTQGPAALAIAFAAHQQALIFLTGNSESVPDVNPALRVLFGRNLFEVPAFLPETTGFGR